MQILAAALLVLAGCLSAQNDYCKLCERPGTHTGCLFPEPGPGKNCSGYSSSPLTAEEKWQILDLHNKLRSKVARGRGWVTNSSYGPQPQAADMHQLYWDAELEMMSQRWADQCLPFYTSTPHDACRDSKRFPVGQNIVTSAYSRPVPSDVRARTLDWYNEIKDYNPAGLENFLGNADPSRQTGHYTQLVWGWSYLLGCSRVLFEEYFEDNKWFVERIVCNYAPSGNFLEFPVYTQGPPCSECPRGTTCSNKYKGLCRLEAVEEDSEFVEIPPDHQLSTTTADPIWRPALYWMYDFKKQQDES